MIDVYTDASVSHGSAIATVFVLSPNYFIGLQSFRYEKVSSSLQGELLGIRDGLAYAIEHSKEPDHYNVYCDSLSAINLILSNEINGKSKQFKTILDSIKSLCNGNDIEFKLIKGHQVNHNPNKVVDLISNSILRLEKTKGVS